MTQSFTRFTTPWTILAAVACLLAGSAAAADRVVLAEAFVDDG